MKAIGLTRYLAISDPDSLVAVELPTPTPQGHDLLVRVQGVSVNPVDVKVRAPKPGVESQPRVLGWDAAGEVVAVGGDVTLFATGDLVYYAGSINRPGSNAEYQLVDERIVGPKPQSLAMDEAAGMPLTSITAWEALFDRLEIARDPAANIGKSILIIGGAGGVGSIATQIAKRLAGLQVIATASRPETQAWVREMGADAVVDHRQPLVPQLTALGFPTVDYIFCLNSTEQHFPQMAELIAPQGKICSIVEIAHGQSVDLNLLQSKSASFIWELMFTRPLYQTADMIAQHKLLKEVAQLLDTGVLRSTVTERLGPLTPENLRRAHEMVETGRMIGKLVLGGIEG